MVFKSKGREVEEVDKVEILSVLAKDGRPKQRLVDVHGRGTRVALHADRPVLFVARVQQRRVEGRVVVYEKGAIVRLRKRLKLALAVALEFDHGLLKLLVLQSAATATNKNPVGVARVLLLEHDVNVDELAFGRGVKVGNVEFDAARAFEVVRLRDHVLRVVRFVDVVLCAVAAAVLAIVRRHVRADEHGVPKHRASARPRGAHRRCGCGLPSPLPPSFSPALSVRRATDYPLDRGSGSAPVRSGTTIGRIQTAARAPSAAQKVH